jgi:serine/threonine protein phosphatase 1
MIRYAIGDIHGGSKTLMALLKRLNLSHMDRLYLLGDYVDRGNDSKGVLTIIIELQKAGYDVRPLRGNHDDMMLNALLDDNNSLNFVKWYENWGMHTLASFDEMFVCGIPDVYSTFLESLPTIYVEDDFVLVHAGLDMSTHDPIRQTSDFDKLWTASQSVDSNKLGGRSLVVGHRIHTLEEIRASLKTNHIRLDNGAFANKRPGCGNLVALNLDAMTLTAQPWLDEDLEYNYMKNYMDKFQR